MRYLNLPLTLVLFSSVAQGVELNEQWSVTGTLEAEYQVNRSQGKTEKGGRSSYRRASAGIGHHGYGSAKKYRRPKCLCRQR